MDNQQGPIIYHMELYSMLCGSLDGRGEWTHVYVWLSPFTVHLKTTTTLLIGYTPIQNKRFKVWGKNPGYETMIFLVGCGRQNVSLAKDFLH